MKWNKFTRKSKQRSTGHKIVLNFVELQNQYHGSTESNKNERKKEKKKLHKTHCKLILTTNAQTWAHKNWTVQTLSKAYKMSEK
jgi:hypothetical protein